MDLFLLMDGCASFCNRLGSRPIWQRFRFEVVASEATGVHGDLPLSTGFVAQIRCDGARERVHRGEGLKSQMQLFNDLKDVTYFAQTITQVVPTAASALGVRVGATRIICVVASTEEHCPRLQSLRGAAGAISRATTGGYHHGCQGE